jgi:hypothetical protein
LATPHVLPCHTLPLAHATLDTALFAATHDTHATPGPRAAADAARRSAEASSAAEQALEGKLRGLRATAAALKSESSSSGQQSAVVAALLEAKRAGEIPGVYGRLGDLGAIDAK